MKRVLMLLVLVALVSACDDNRLNMDPDWYLAGGGEQQLFRQIKVTRNDMVGSKAVPSSTIITVTADRLVTRSVLLADEHGVVSEVCSGSALVDGMEYQAFTALLAEAGLMSYEEPEDAVCPEDVSYNYEISYLRLDGKAVDLSSIADTCPFTEAIEAVITQIESIADSGIEDCSAASAAAAAAAAEFPGGN
ncbi:MAG TPA: hypothetical protein PLZ86_09270 [bacterium]|nr:hypothetical protein [bacterium]